MIYQGNEVEILGKKTVFGEEIAWIKIHETGEFFQIPAQDLALISTGLINLLIQQRWRLMLMIS